MIAIQDCQSLKKDRFEDFKKTICNQIKEEAKIIYYNIKISLTKNSNKVLEKMAIRASIKSYKIMINLNTNQNINNKSLSIQIED